MRMFLAIHFFLFSIICIEKNEIDSYFEVDATSVKIIDSINIVSEYNCVEKENDESACLNDNVNDLIRSDLKILDDDSKSIISETSTSNAEEKSFFVEHKKISSTKKYELAEEELSKFQKIFEPKDTGNQLYTPVFTVEPTLNIDIDRKRLRSMLLLLRKSNGITIEKIPLIALPNFDQKLKVLNRFSSHGTFKLIKKHHVNWLLGENYYNIEKVFEFKNLIFEARNKQTHEHVCIKIYLNSQNKPLNDLQEIRALCLLDDKKIVKLIEVYQYGKLIFMILEYIPETLLTLPIDPKLIKKQILALIELLQYIHSKGIIHRDFKLDNILLLEDGSIKLCDFEACSINETHPSTDDGNYSTTGYKPPELYLITEEHDKTVDIFSLGCCIFILITGNFLIPVKDRWLYQMEMKKLLLDYETGVMHILKSIGSIELAFCIMACCRYNPADRIELSVLKKRIEAIDFNSSIFGGFLHA